MARQRPLQAVKSAANNANYTVDVLRGEARAFFARLKQGVNVTFVRKGNARWMDFLTGKAKEFPIGLKVDFGDEEDEDE